MIDEKKQSKLIGICICTFNRPVGLNRLLNSLNSLQINTISRNEIRTIIIDNSINRQSKNIIDEHSSSFKFTLYYDIEPTQGIASARNLAVKRAKDCDFIAFIDDDEIADPNWLNELINIQEKTNADIVSGPVLPLFEIDPPRWIVKGGFFNRRRHATGTKFNQAATGNILFKSTWLTKYEEPFDTKFNLTGGEDTAFTRKIIQEGATCYWADNAIAYEYNPPTRFKVSWILLRSLRTGWTLTTAEKYLKNSFSTLLLRFIKSIFHILKGVILILPYLIFLGFAGLIKSLSLIFRGVGELLGFTPLKYQPYK